MGGLLTGCVQRYTIDVPALLALNLPHIVVLTVPMGLLIGAFLVATRSRRNSASPNFLRPLVIWAGLLTLFVGSGTTWWMPRANREVIERLRTAYLSTNPAVALPAGDVGVRACSLGQLLSRRTTVSPGSGCPTSSSPK